MLGVLQAVLPSAGFAQTWPKLISLWTFDETSGTRFADSGPADLPMAIAGTWADLSTGSLIREIGGTSAYTNGSAYATIPADHPDHDLAALTISFYYQRNSTAAKQILLAAGDGTQAGDFSIEVLPNGRLRGYHVGQDGVLRFFEGGDGITGTNLQVGTAHRIDLTLGLFGARIYLDGAPLTNAFILANWNGWNNSRIKYLGIFSDGASAPADGAFDGMRIWNRQLSGFQVAALEAAQSIPLSSPSLPLAPTMDFLASDGTLPGSNLVYVYDTNLGDGSGSSAANAKEIQAALNAATAGKTLVAIAAAPGGTASYNRSGGLTFNASGASGNPITLMARPGDTVIIDRALEFAAYRTPSAGLGTKWELFNAGQHIWRSVSTGFGSTVRPLGGVWFEGGWPHYILPCDSLAHLQANDGLDNIWTSYGGPAALVHSDGRIYVRWEIPYAPKMSKNNRWPVDGRMDYMAGWIGKSGGTAGQLHFPATQDPRDYEIWLAYSPGGGANAGVAFDLRNRSWVTIGEGINSFGYGISYYTGGCTNVTFKRGTDFSLQYGIVATSTQPGPVTFNRRRMTHGSIKHQPLVNWKFGGALEANWRGAFAPWAGNNTNNCIFRDCTWHGWHDFCTAIGSGWDIQQSTFVNLMDDGFQVIPSGFTNFNIHYCYFLDSAFGGCEQTGNAPTASYVSHCVFDSRCPRLVDVGTAWNGEPFFMPLNQLHMTGGGEQPLKWYNNTIIWAPDAQGNDNCYMNHIQGNNPAVLGAFHEVFNNIWVRTDYQRYTGASPSGNWAGRSDEIVCRINCGGGSKEIFDYEIHHRDVPGAVSSLYHDIVTSPVGGGSPSSHGGASYPSLAAWQASAQFIASKGIYSPGFFANSYQVDPQIPNCPTGGFVPNFDARRNYRPAASQAANGYAGTVTSPAGQSMASWKVPPSPWIGALDPSGSSLAIGVPDPLSVARISGAAQVHRAWVGGDRGKRAMAATTTIATRRRPGARVVLGGSGPNPAEGEACD